ncbi:ferredoxin-dependent glutamate synthase [Halorubrum aidingense JCM 13560]|uniref:Ferredoxin-dependent glutamate synthase n=1 Tax=Halorubrum aidingense JCM 13560 TaxID=1230454 RepID=M0PHK3_9EURY|nr:glutamate synthase large subunit [Halorubrum aidingense]EMA69541.1 ferredoxin-dependent glutamate synthase [Halorubrum aidingense JCM 13560]
MTKPRSDTRGADEADPAGRGEGLAAVTDERSNCGIGGIVDLDGDPTHDTVTDAVRLLENLEHRGTTGAEENTGDGAGIMVARPDEFFREVVDADLPEEYAVGSVFMPTEPSVQAEIHDVIAEVFSVYGLEVLAWRSVPTDNADLGETALDSEPEVAQLFAAPVEGAGLAERFTSAETRPDDVDPEILGFDRALYAARREIENTTADVDGAGRFYVCSLDRQRVVYKGLLKGSQLGEYYPDLTDERFASHVALVHARFSTNTLGAWHLAHPYRNIVHNGEFNTIRGNVNWMRARKNDLEHPAFGAELDTIKPVIDDPNQSDTASVDNAVELLLQTGRDLSHILRMLIPEAFRNDDLMDQARADFYDYHASLVEPWDGPALVIGFDGDRVAGVLDRNGLRPCRYEVTDDNRLVVGSEVGALPTDPSNVTRRGRLQPGEIFVADPEQGRIVPDDEVFDELTDDTYGEWVADGQVDLDDVVEEDDVAAGVDSIETDSEDDDSEAPTVRAHQAAFGYTTDSLNHLVEPMAKDGKDPVGSMGDDTPLSVLADVDRPLFTYFKQLFAQVSNPPIDYIREELVTSLETRIGNQRNLLDETPEHAEQLVSDSPVLTDAETVALKAFDGEPIENAESGEPGPSFSTRTVDTTYHRDGSLVDAVSRIREDAAAAIRAGADVVVLSDRAIGSDRLAVPSLLATGAVHHHLVRNGLRNRAGLVVESGEPHEVHHLATLVGYGADAVDPYLAYASIADVVAGPDGADESEALAAYRHALEDGLLKTMAKMGISTMESYQGAQIFEAVGLDSAFVAEYFEGTEIRTEGIGAEQIEDDLRTRHAMAFGADPELETIGEYEHRSSGVKHGWNPQTVGTLQQAVRGGDYEQYQEFAELVNDQSETLQSLRGLLEFESDRDPVPVEEVESIESIVKRFSTAAMSLGSLSPEAHENNAIAMNRLGAKSNTGEGGEPPERFDTEKECNVKQVASGRFGVTSEYLAKAEELQIKMAQGSKPGEGGHLPGEKVNEMIAHVRCSTPGVGLISPPPQHDIYSIEDLKQLIFDLKAASPDADVNVKLVSEAGIGTIAAGVAKANADVVHVSGHDGGTGASPKTSIKNAGLPWELGLAETNQMLRATGLRDRIRVTADGGLKTGRDVAVAAALGAEEYVFGTASLVTSGCVMARQCHENTCPVGVATQREDLRNRFPGQPDHVINYMTFIAQELRELMAELGYTDLEEFIGRPELLTQRETDHEKAKHLDLSAVVAEPAGDARTKARAQTHPGIDELLDWDLIEEASPAIEDGAPVALTRDVDNVDRAIGATLSNRVVSAHGGDGLPDDTVTCRFDGYAGQSFGAFLAPGITLELDGAANDYVGKGLSGGRLVINTPAEAGYDPAENVVAGNVCLYGATSGELYVNGVAGERFGVRNSGVKAVVEGVGDHGCEYMTGGVVAVLGDTGRNFAAGMSGGIAYVYDPDDRLAERVNRGMVSISSTIEDADERMLRRLVENHRAYTDSDRAAELLDDWQAAIDDFVRVFPDAYADVIAAGKGADVRDEPPAAAEAVPGSAADATGQVSGDD